MSSKCLFDYMSSARMSTKCLQMSVRVLETRPEHRTALTPAQARGHRNSGPSVPRIIDSGTRPGPQSWTEGVSLSPSGRQLQRDTTSPWSKVGECGADAQADAARAAGGGLSRVVGSGSPAKDAHKRGDDESLDLLLRFTSDFGTHRCEDYPIE